MFVRVTAVPSGASQGSQKSDQAGEDTLGGLSRSPRRPKEPRALCRTTKLQPSHPSAVLCPLGDSAEPL